MAAGQEAELGTVQAPSRYTQAIKPMFQAYHQGPPGWGQGCRVPCEEYEEGYRWMEALAAPWSHSTAAHSPPSRLSFPPLLLTSHH